MLNVKIWKVSVKHTRGFTITELLAVITITAILALIAKTVYPAFKVYARRAEAKNNLAHLRVLQISYLDDYSAYAALAAVGYAGTGASICSGSAYNNVLGFRPDDCSELRYEYSANVNGLAFEAYAYGRSDANKKWIYNGCTGRGALQYGKNQGDLLSIKHDRGIEVCRDIVEYCPASGGTGSSASKCGTPLAAGTSTPRDPSKIVGVTPVPFKPLLPPGLPPELPLLDVPIHERTSSCRFILNGFQTGILPPNNNDYSYSLDCSSADCMNCPVGGSEVYCNISCGNASRDSSGKCACSSSPCASIAYTGFCNTTQDPTAGTCTHNIHLSATPNTGSYEKPVVASFSGNCR